MRGKSDIYVRRANRQIHIRENLRQIITILSLVVILGVFWCLKLTGITMAGEAFCGMEEHVHSADCLKGTLLCTLEETPAHIHDENCRIRTLICQLEESEEHTHTEECWQVEEGYGCALEETAGHTHTEACYEILEACPLQEHIHIESCYSDINADLETSDDWEMTLADMVRGPTTRSNVVLVAQSQLGYTESTRNFQVDASGVRRGITRYGQWYGNPYGDWSAMFASFCLEYAGVMDLPMNAGPEAMRLEWEAEGLYVPAREAWAEAGNLVFLAKNPESTAANSVAIVTDVEESAICVIEGDLEHMVAQTRYDLEDPVILGYGIVPSGEIPVLFAAGDTPIATRVTYSNQTLTSDSLYVLYAIADSQAYAFDGNGNAVPVTVDANGNIYADVSNPDILLWSASKPNNRNEDYYLQNVGTGRYMHSFSNNGTGVTTTNAYTARVTKSGNGAKIRSNTSDYAQLNGDRTAFQHVANQNSAAEFYVGITQKCTVWLDGTDGGLGHLTGSPDTAYSAYVGGTMKLPTEWTSPSKYSYKLRGWYDVTNSRYYQPGEEMVVTGNTVLYADWVASTYDIGEFNAHVVESESTSSFITTHMFDYNYLFNVQSATAQKTVSATDHSEQWSMVTSGNVEYQNQQTFDFIFVDNDSGGLLCIPNNRDSDNTYGGEGVVTSGIYTSQLGNLLFSTDNCYDPNTGTGVLGKTYLGTGDYLFQLEDDPSSEYYGYYYYDSRCNAASYNQSNGRFYVYEYLSATSDSIGGAYSDFLPLNSPYANTNGKTVGTYNYAGVDGEYEGVPHYRFDSKYNSGDHNNANNVQTDYAYGMRTDIKFYLPNDPGTGGNKDLYGNDMQFRFSGDDDLWVLIDGKLALDIGGIHQAEDGVIDFSTGEVTVQGNQQTSLMDLGIGEGDHTMTILYLERGSSMSNCSIYFNMAPRFSLQLQKEDVLTQEMLDGAQFTVYRDLECTIPAELWTSEEAYNADLADGVLDQAQNTFTIENGVARMWGMGSGNTYYLKETRPPDKEGYGLASGVIRLKLEREGQTTYLVEMIPDAEGNTPSNGYTIHGVEIDEQTKTVYLVVTNAPETVTEVTTVQVAKLWEDTADHSNDYIQAYLTVTDPDGTVRRIREVTLSDENDWMYIWTNLPKYDYDAMTEVQYGIEESYESGYYSTVRRITEVVINKTTWAEALTFINGETYILRTNRGCLSTQDDRADTGYMWVDEETAKTSPNALWTAKVSNGRVTFTNGKNQTITLYYNNGNPTDFYARVAAPQTQDRQDFSYSSRNGGLQFYYQGNKNYYLTATMTNGSKFKPSDQERDSLIFTPIRRITQSDIHDVEDWGYQITNTPLPPSNETAFAVEKEWNIPAGYDKTLYQEYAVTVQLLANGVRTGRSVTLNLKNNWKSSFLGLPYKDDNGNVIVYTVMENWERPNWSTHYSQIQTSGTTPPTYAVTITNTYHPGGPELPATGSAGRMLYMLCGWSIILGSLVYGIGSRRKRERRMD